MFIITMISGWNPEVKSLTTQSWSDDEDDDDDDDIQPPLAAPIVDRREQLRGEFARVFKAFRVACSNLDWHTLFPDLDLPERINVLDDLLTADLGVVYKSLIASDPGRKKYGYLPRMATHSRASVGSLLASSFCERINSAANLIVTKGNTLLSDEEIDMCTTLRMNKGFMSFMREHYSHVSLEQFKMTILTDEQNTEEADY